MYFGGKGCCDRKAATIKSHMAIHLNSGHDIESVSRNGREHIAFSHGQKLLSNQFLHNFHFTKDEESMKELTLVRFPLM